MFDCLLIAARHHQNEATAFLGDNRQWIERDSKFSLGQCLRETAGHGKIVKSIPEVRCGVAGVEVDGPAKQYRRLIPLPVVPRAQKAQRRIRFGEIGIETYGSLDGTVRRGDSGLLWEQLVFCEDCKAVAEAGPS